MSMQAIANVTKFTDTDEYEMIVVDPTAKYPIRDDYHVLKIDKHLKPRRDPGYTGAMNLGAKEAKGDYIVFIQNDVFVHEGWLPGLRQYLETGKYDVVWPDQVPRDRAYVKASYDRDPFEPESLIAGRDAGLIMMTRDIFDKSGGWNKELGLLAEKEFYVRLSNAGARWTDTNKVIITHIMAATNLALRENDPETYDKRMRKDADKLNG